MIAIISNKIDQYQNYNFKINFSKNYNKELKKCFNYNIKNHPNFLMNQFQLQSIKNNFKIDHYENIKNKDKIKFFIFLDVINHEEILSKKPKILIILEYKSIKPILYKKKNHKYFDKVFTFEKGLLDKKKYFFYNGLNVIPKKTFILNNKKKFSKCIFFANRPNNNSESYFKERIRIIDYYKNKPQDLHLYGSNWDKFAIPMNISIFKKIIFYIIKIFLNFFKIKKKKYLKIWKGFSKNLIVTKSKYKYCFVVENSSTLSGRIFLSFYAGTIPIYFGDTKKIIKIPKSCYINFKKFYNFQKLENYLNNISVKKYTKIQNNIRKFINSNAYQQYTVENDAFFIFKEIRKLI